MKKLLLFIVLAVTTGGLFAQTNFRFADSTAQWNVLYTEGAWCFCVNYQTSIYKVTTDTVVNGLNYQSVNSNFFFRRDSLSRVFLRELNDTVEQLAYDFSKQAGDTFTLSTQNWGVFCRVDSTDTVTLDGQRKRMYVTYNNDSWKSDVWVDGIGSLNSNFLHPGIDHSIIDGGFWSLLCYYRDGNLVYHDTAIQVCELDTVIYMGVKNESSNNRIAIIPNPATDFITIQTENNLPPQTTFQLYDITGRMVLQKQLTGKETTVPLNEISKGLYVYSVTSYEKKMGSGKLVVQ